MHSTPLAKVEADAPGALAVKGRKDVARGGEEQAEHGVLWQAEAACSRENRAQPGARAWSTLAQG